MVPMPPLPRLRVAALSDLLQQVRFAPREAVRRMIERAEAYAASLADEALVDESDLVRAITGYAPDLAEPATLVGGALLGDLSRFVELLCAQVALRPDEAPPGALTPEALQARWNVSRKTIDRWRARGLVARRVSARPGHAQIVFAPASAEAFEARAGGLIRRASGFSRMDDALRARVVRHAGRYRRRFGCSLNQVALRLAQRYGRSHEAVRQVLLQHDRGPAPIFRQAGPMTARHQRLCLRAWRRGIDAPELARRLGRSPAAIRRAVNMARLDFLRALDLPAGPGEPSEDVIGAPPAREGLRLSSPRDLASFLAFGASVGAPVAAEERARALAIVHLQARAQQTIARIHAINPEAGMLDEAETDLRLASRLIAAQVRAQLPTVLRALRDRLNRPFEELRGPVLLALLTGALGAAARAAREFDPGVGGRLAARVSLAVSRACEPHLDRVPAPAPGLARALPRLVPGVLLPDWTRRVAPWQPELELRPGLLEAAGGLGAPLGVLLTRRFGPEPVTLALAAAPLGASAAARLERRALRAARGA